MPNSKHVLIVDDSPGEILRFETILHSHGFETTAVSNGEDGIIVSAEIQPDIILMDVVMGGINGFQATRQITSKKATQHIPVIMVTTKDQATDRVWASRQGAKGYLIKPVDEQELLNTITSLLESE